MLPIIEQILTISSRGNGNLPAHASFNTSDQASDDPGRAERRIEVTLFLVGSNSFPGRERQSARLLSFKGGVSAVRSISHRRRWVKLERARDRRKNSFDEFQSGCARRRDVIVRCGLRFDCPSAGVRDASREFTRGGER